MCSCKTEHRPGCAFDRRSPGNHDTRIQKQPHGCSRRRRMSASSSAIQRAISSAENTRGSGSAAPSVRSREARKSINSCFSAGESETAAASISASVTIRTSVHASKAIRKAYVPRPRANGPNHFLAPACSFLRVSGCVGFYVALLRAPSFSSGKTEVCAILLGELSHFGKEWHTEAGGGKTFCLSSFLQVVDLGRPQPCHSLPPPARIQYATFYATVQKRTPATATGE